MKIPIDSPLLLPYTVHVFETVNHEKCLDKIMKKHCRGELYQWEFSFVFHKQANTNSKELKSTIFIQQSFFALVI